MNYDDDYHTKCSHINKYPFKYVPFAVADAVAVVAVAVAGLIAAKNLVAVAFEIGPVAEPVAFAFVAVVVVNAATVTDYADCLSCAVMMSY